MCVSMSEAVAVSDNSLGCNDYQAFALLRQPIVRHVDNIVSEIVAWSS